MLNSQISSDPWLYFFGLQEYIYKMPRKQHDKLNREHYIQNIQISTYKIINVGKSKSQTNSS